MGKRWGKQRLLSFAHTTANENRPVSYISDSRTSVAIKFLKMNTPYSLSNPPPAPVKQRAKGMSAEKLWRQEPRTLFQEGEESRRRRREAKEKEERTFNIDAAINCMEALHFEATHDGPHPQPDGSVIYL